MGTSILAIITAGLWSILAGALWYHPRVFGAVWMREARIDPVMASARASQRHFFIWASFFANVIMAYVLSYIINAFDVSGITDAVSCALWVWIGCVVPVVLGAYLWEGKSVTLVCVNALYWLVSITGAVFIITFW